MRDDVKNAKRHPPPVWLHGSAEFFTVNPSINAEYK